MWVTLSIFRLVLDFSSHLSNYLAQNLTSGFINYLILKK